MTQEKVAPWVWFLGGILSVLLVCGLVTLGLLLTVGRNFMQGGMGGWEITPPPTIRPVREEVPPTPTPVPATSTPMASPTAVAEGTPTPAAADTPTPATVTPAVSPTPAASPTPEGCTLVARFIADVTVPDGTVFPPGAQFTKVWRLLNAGTCTWTTAFVAFFFAGEPLGAPHQVPLPYEVPPGRQVDIRVPMQAPEKPGTYQSFWKLRSPDGQVFGIGEDAALPFWVEIRVEEPTPTPTPTATPLPTATPTPTATPSATP